MIGAAGTGGADVSRVMDGGGAASRTAAAGDGALTTAGGADATGVPPVLSNAERAWVLHPMR